MADRDAVVGAALKTWQILGDRVVNACDRAVGDRGAGERRRERLCHRKGSPAAVLIETQRVSLQKNLSVANHKEASNVAGFHKARRVPWLAFVLVPHGE